MCCAEGAKKFLGISGRSSWEGQDHPPPHQFVRAGGGSDPPSANSFVLGRGSDPPSANLFVLGGGSGVSLFRAPPPGAISNRPMQMVRLRRVSA